MKSTLKTIVLVLTLSLMSCKNSYTNEKVIQGSGHLVTEQRTINEPFDKIASSSGVHVIVEQGVPNEVSVETDDNLLSHVITKVENGTLIIKIEGSIYTMTSLDVRVKMSEIVSLESSSGSKINSKNTLKGNSIRLNSSSGSEIKAALEFENVSCETSSGSKIVVFGKTLNLDTNSSSGSKIQAADLAANNVVAQSSSGSSITVRPIVKLDGNASSGSRINYVQIPHTLAVNESSRGTIKKN